MKKRLLLAMLVIGILASAGCDGKNEETNGEVKKLTYWSNLTSYASTVVNNMADTPLYQKIMEITGTEIEFIHPPQGQATEKFNIMIASDELPDIIQHNWQNYPGGPQKAIDDKVIIDINEYKDFAPNINAYLAENDDARRMATTDSNAMFAFPCIRGSDDLKVTTGLIIRQDWLDELNLEMPETVEEWETVLRTFKEKKGAKAPLSISMSNMKASHLFAGAFDVGIDYYLDDGQMKYGMLEPGFKDFLALMNKWYKEGLLDPDFSTLDTKIIDSNILNGMSGAIAGALGSGIGRYMSSATEEGFQLVGAPFPTGEKGTLPEFGYWQPAVAAGNAAAISYDCKDKETAVKLLDFGYGEEGMMLFNFGIEGESYEMQDDYPKYTEMITDNEEGLAMTVALSKYTLAYDAGPFIQDRRYLEQYANLPEQQQAWATWKNTNMSEHVVPYLYVKEGEVSELANLNNSIDTYANEMIIKFIMGTEPIENYDAAVAQLKERGVERVIEMKQAAYERYLSK